MAGILRPHCPDKRRHAIIMLAVVGTERKQLKGSAGFSVALRSKLRLKDRLKIVALFLKCKEKCDIYWSTQITFLPPGVATTTG